MFVELIAFHHVYSTIPLCTITYSSSHKRYFSVVCGRYENNMYYILYGMGLLL